MIKNLIITTCYIGGILLFNSTVLADTPSSTKEIKQEPELPNFLDYVEIEVEGKNHTVKNGNSLQIVKGDKLIIKDARLLTDEYRITNVNLVGFVSPTATSVAEDRNLVVDTVKDMMINWATYKEDGKEVYQITVSQGRKRLGFVYLNVCEPKLKEVAVNINGTITKIKHGDIITLNEDDKIKVEDVITNLEKDTNPPLKVQIVPVKSVTGDNEAVKFYEIRFLRKDTIFSWIPLQVKQKDKG